MSNPTEFYRWVQSRLNEHGARIEPDGIWGGQSRKALQAFQRSRGLRITGQTDPLTIAALRREPNGGLPDPRTMPAGEIVPPWHAELRRQIGLHEVRNRDKLWAWLRSGGSTLGDPSKLPWCGAAMMAAISLTLPDEPLPAKPYWARDWLNFGRSCGYVRGAIAVFSRPGGGGHVASLDRQTSTHVIVVGGNQSNAMTEASLSKDRLIGLRWPSTFDVDLREVATVLRGPAVSTNEA